jgi:hypothetical protein
MENQTIITKVFTVCATGVAILFPMVYSFEYRFHTVCNFTVLQLMLLKPTVHVVNFIHPQHVCA